MRSRKQESSAMPCPWRISHLQLLITVTFLVTEHVSVGAEGIITSSTSFATHATEKTSKNYYSSASRTSSLTHETNFSTKPTEGNSSETVSVGAKVVLSCPLFSQSLMLASWEIDFGGKFNCVVSYHGEENKTGNTCSDERITWASRPDQNPALQINPVAASHEGNYKCYIVIPEGNFLHTYRLKILVPPEVTVLRDNKTAVCTAAAGKPAARITWTPEEACVSTELRAWSNDTVTIQSTCHLAENAENVHCSVFHLTGNTTRSIELSQNKYPLREIYYCILSIFITLIIIMGFICFLKSHDCRKCKFKEREDSLVVEEDEMQPYASYTEKNNPLYDTTNRAKTPHA